jgi:hypothetical protein
MSLLSCRNGEVSIHKIAQTSLENPVASLGDVLVIRSEQTRRKNPLLADD